MHACSYPSPSRASFRRKCCWLLLALAASPAAGSEDIPPEQRDFFERQIRPVFAERCYGCHAAAADPLQGGLRVDSAKGLRAGGDSGPALVPGKPAESLLLQALRYESYEMPPDGKLPAEVIERFAQWIEMGAPDPRTEDAAPAGPSATTSAAADHWAFRPPVKPEVPAVAAADWPQTEVDRFVLARLEQRGLTPSQAAPPRVQLRRLSYALTGLPPAAEELETWERAADEDGYAAAVERLLASPRFGERWGRHWLDVARYSDTKGYVFQEDRNYPQAYTYRDWVIRAFNEDLPYDRFLVAQLAADQVGDPTAKPAAGFLTLGRRFINNQHDIIDDRIDVTTRGLLGLTVTCARCHDHKYDPISMADYYSLYGVFASSREPHEEAAPLLLVDSERPVEPVIFVRGNAANRGERVPRRFLACLTKSEPQPFAQGSGRLELARAIADTGNPLTARVWVNRVWMHLFGAGLVATPSDFGTRSDPPSHPELLDWLACRFVDEGWSTKWLVRTLVTSQVYRQASDDRPDCREADPENRLLWRMNRRRLDLESLRDSMLAAAGRLDLSMGGPSVEITAAPFPTRRTVYGFIERQNLPNFFRTFDFAGPDTHAPQRPHTVVPQQTLYLMNSPFALEQARHLAEREEVRGAEVLPERIRRMFRAALGRDPSEEEVALAEAFLAADGGERDRGGADADSPGSYGCSHCDEGAADGGAKRAGNSTDDSRGPGPDPAGSWQLLAQILLMTNEFAFTD